MKLSLFDYHLPEELIAQYPLDNRDESRLMVINKKEGSIDHRIFSQLPDFLNAGDLLVINNTKVIPARLIGRKEKSGGEVEILLLSPKSATIWEALVKRSGRMGYGTNVIFGDGSLSAKILDKTDSGGRIVQLEGNDDLKTLLDRFGKPPLPPYIKRNVDAKDKDRYQTIYAKNDGAVAAPTAGLHFTKSVFEGLRAKGVNRTELTLHVGLGTFQPVKSDNIEEHSIHSEVFDVPKGVADQVNEVKFNGGKVVAVGTTSVRALESSVDVDGKVKAGSGSTDIFIYPGYGFRVVDAMITNFHLPKSTLLMLVSAFAGRELIMEAYHEAVQEKYRFYSYGDAMLIL